MLFVGPRVIVGDYRHSVVIRVGSAISITQLRYQHWLQKVMHVLQVIIVCADWLCFCSSQDYLQ
jgi:hypothetical protein